MGNDIAALARALYAGDMTAAPALLDALREGDDPRWREVLRLVGWLYGAAEDAAKGAELSLSSWCRSLGQPHVLALWEKFSTEMEWLFWLEITGQSLAGACRTIAAHIDTAAQAAGLDAAHKERARRLAEMPNEEKEESAAEDSLRDIQRMAMMTAMEPHQPRRPRRRRAE